jgi:LmbE family N-acetylglucosaminyl deacetylase
MRNKDPAPLTISYGRKYGRLCSIGLLRGLILILLLTGTTILYDEAQAFSNLHLSDLTPLVLPPAARLLVISPHPDDEMLAGGGLIQHVLEAGGQVEVVMVTNGDGQYFAPLLINGRIHSYPADYIAMGQRRQKETLKALSEIGLKADQVIFLGYPDRQIWAMWNGDWQQKKLIRAPYTHSTRSPYVNTYARQSEYLGSDLYHDLTSILEHFQPEVILLPHPEDTNSDHNAVSDFARFAIAGFLDSSEQQPPMILTYLIHYEAYPVPRGNNTSKVLLPPAPLADGGADWFSYSLTEQERSNKRDALRAYFSQLRLMPNYLKSFARANEIFLDLPVTGLPVIGIDDHPVLENDLQKESSSFEPRRERFDRLLFKSADLVNWKVSRIGDLVCFAAQTRGPLTKRVNYRILAKLPDGRNLQVSKKEDLLWIGDRLFGACFHLSELGDPASMGFAAQTSSTFVLDQTAWHFVYFSSLQVLQHVP